MIVEYQSTCCDTQLMHNGDVLASGLRRIPDMEDGITS